jgi:hypothetical protein
MKCSWQWQLRPAAASLAEGSAMAANLFSSAPSTGNVICAVLGLLVSPSSYDLSGRARGARSGETLETSCRNRQRRRGKSLRVRADPRECLFSGPAAFGVGKPTVEVTPGGRQPAQTFVAMTNGALAGRQPRSRFCPAALARAAARARASWPAGVPDACSLAGADGSL